MRRNRYLLFVDLKRAFDSVPRARLLEKLKQKGVSQQLINFFADSLMDTTMNVKGEKIKTNIGVP